MNWCFKPCWNPIEFWKRLIMALRNLRGPAEARWVSRFVESPTLGPCVIIHDLQEKTGQVFTLNAGLPPKPWEPEPIYRDGVLIKTKEDVRSSVEESLRSLVHPYLRKKHEVA
jgi:hypothetical protein